MRSSGSVVDTSIWIDFFRGVPWVKDLLKRMIIEGRVFIVGPILFELLQGVRSSKEKRQVREALLSIDYLELSSRDWEEAASLSSDLRGKGVTIPMTDLLVAQLAKRHDLFVLSFDVHFDQIPGVKHQRPGP